MKIEVKKIENIGDMYAALKNVTSAEGAEVIKYEDKLFMLKEPVQPDNTDCYLNRLFWYEDNILRGPAGVAADTKFFVDAAKILGFVIEREGRSGISHRNSIRVLEQSESKKIKVIILDDEKCWGQFLNAYGATSLEYSVEELEILSHLEEHLQMTQIKTLAAKMEADVELEEVKKALGGAFSGYVEIGGYEPIQSVPEGFTSLYSVRSKCTADGRSGRGHTYRQFLISTSVNGVLNLEIKEDEKGLAFGKGGSNIKSAQAKCKAKLVIK